MEDHNGPRMGIEKLCKSNLTWVQRRTLWPTLCWKIGRVPTRRFIWRKLRAKGCRIHRVQRTPWRGLITKRLITTWPRLLQEAVQKAPNNTTYQYHIWNLSEAEEYGSRETNTCSVI